MAEKVLELCRQKYFNRWQSPQRCKVNFFIEYLNSLLHMTKNGEYCISKAYTVKAIKVILKVTFHTDNIEHFGCYFEIWLYQKVEAKINMKSLWIFQYWTFGMKKYKLAPNYLIWFPHSSLCLFPIPLDGDLHYSMKDEWLNLQILDEKANQTSKQAFLSWNNLAHTFIVFHF